MAALIDCIFRDWFILLPLFAEHNSSVTRSRGIPPPSISAHNKRFSKSPHNALSQKYVASRRYEVEWELGYRTLNQASQCQHHDPEGSRIPIHFWLLFSTVKHQALAICCYASSGIEEECWMSVFEKTVFRCQIK